MKRFLLIALTALPFMGYSQYLLYNDGAMIKVDPGAMLFVEGGIHNTATGTIDNDGTIELEGDLLNQGTWENSQPNTLKFSGATDSDVTPGTAQFYNVVIEKDDTYNVNLLGNMTITNNLDFNAAGSSKLVLDAFNLSLGGSATATGHDANEYVMTNGTGRMSKAFTSLTTFQYPVGHDASTYNPATLEVTAGPNDTYSVRVGASPTDGDGLTGTPLTEDVVDAVWDITENTAGGNTVNLTLNWAQSDQLTGFNEALNSVSKNDGVNGWDGLFADLGPEVANSRTRTGITSFSAFAVGGKPLANQLDLGLSVFLQGPYSTSTHLMGEALRTLNYIPLSEPYTAAPYNYAHLGYGGGESVPSNAIFDQPSAGDDIVDWIVVELRNSATPNTKLATVTALLQRDGDIVDLDGTSSLKMYGMADGSYHVGLRHRNHLTVRTQNPVSLSGSLTSLDFTAPGVAYDNGVGNAPMKEVEPGVYGLWAGDANLDNKVRVTPLLFPPPGVASDRTYILDNALGGNPSGQLNGYYNSDINMDGRVRVTPLLFPPPGVPSDATFILDNVLGGNPSGQITADN